MEQRVLGRTGLKVSALGYGAGAVGGLMVRGTPDEQERSLARAFEAGITYVDTAALYGNGESERNLGRALKALGARPLLGTKVRLPAGTRGDIGAAIAASLEASLQRLGRDSVDLFQLHDDIGGAEGLTTAQVLEEALPALQRLREQGKTRFLGITALGAVPALRAVLESGAFDTAQVPFNALNPSWLAPAHAGVAGQDFGQLGKVAAAHGVGMIGIRILAAGALTGSAERHPVAMQSVPPIASGPSFAADVAAALRLRPLVEEGIAGSLAELALRYAIFAPGMGCALIGTASVGQLEAAIAAAEAGPLPAAAVERIGALLA
ncbi:aldo/keto reductase [Paracraurococcus lichenis]|uniref:Aldo/keto reductase n=1 Tax=Paracraurococcus lichenis TaxID=3064888 RepID=A0ABT9DSB0_9PROT|nr:aldo/keto reductase [Paracraurococcus sp. LOR1-02]MDO9706784.1 aldo/keto reductase [Paracraurococcus sp. LOR1-02]